MAFPQGINFRASTGYVSDGANEYAQLVPSSGGNYPTTTPQGNTVGWEGTAYLQVATRDRSATVDHRLAGMNYANTAAIANYRIDLPAAGTYGIRLAAGDAGFSSATQVELFDSTTSLGVLASGVVAAGSFIDAAGTTYTAANWPANNALVAKTFASTICRVGVGSTSSSNRVIAHFYIEAAAGVGTTVAPSGAALTLTGFAPTITQPQTVSPGSASLTLTGYAPTVSQAVVIAPDGAALTITGYAPTVTQAAPQTIAPSGAVLTLTGYAPTVTQYAAPAAGGDGGGAGNVREVRRYADLLDKAHKPTRSQKKKRRLELVAEALELLPDLPEAAEIAPVAARIVFEQESAARATAYANRPIEAMEPVVVPFDAHAALRDLIAKLMADEAMRRELEDEDEFETELLLLGS